MNNRPVNPSTIDIMVGLPHLAGGPLLDRALHLGAPVLISANGLSRWVKRGGWREWNGWALSRLTNARRLPRLCLDSAGFSAMVAYGGYPWTVDDYVALAGAFPFHWWASLDYCVEQEVARDREEVLDRLSRTIRANRDCHRRARDANLDATFLPVIQGRNPADYEQCADALGPLIEKRRLVGVGSMCRRPVHGPDGLIAVVDHLDRILPPRIQLHLFGVKGDAIPYLRDYAHRIASLDSQAYGVSARIAARRERRSKSDRFVADHMERWLCAQYDRLRAPARRLPVQPLVSGDPEPTDAWERAIAGARAQIRTLIEAGDLDHDAITRGWVEQWAADILHAAADD